MNVSIIGLLGTELILILSCLALAWLFISWHQRRQRNRSLAEMVELLDKNAAERTLHYCQWLKSHQGMDDAQADTVANRWLEAEKHFWQAFLAWHLHPDQKTLPDFLHQMQRLLNARLKILAEELAPRDVPTEMQAAPQPPELIKSMESRAETTSEPAVEQAVTAPNLGTGEAPQEERPEGWEESENIKEEEEDDILIYSDSDHNLTSPSMNVSDAPAGDGTFPEERNGEETSPSPTQTDENGEGQPA